jgi:phospholipase C
VERTAWLGSLHQAQFKPLPGTPPLSPDEILTARRSPRALARLPRQEPGLRPSRALPYELSVQAEISQDRQLFSLTFAAGNTRHGARSAGAVFQVYAPPPPGEPAGHPEILPRAYTVAPGSEVRGSWLFADFPGGRCRLQVHGPNGFFRSWQSAAADPDLTVILVENTPATPRHQLTLTIRARRLSQPLTLRLDDPTYGQPSKTLTLKPDAGGEATAVLPCDYRSSHGWHHLRLILVEFPGFEHQLAGRLEDGLPGWSDPALG